ncbi:hypothetical protein P5V15_002340 [Pogonomyrmex californicus]
MMMGAIVEHYCYIFLFNKAVEKRERTHIYFLNYQKNRDEKCPAIENIRHYANMVLSENNGHLSTWLIARLIKAYSNETEYLFSGKVNKHLHVDGVPFDRPDLYVVLSGFHNPDLPEELLSIEVPLTCILEIKHTEKRNIVYREIEEERTIRRDETQKGRETPGTKIYEDALNDIPNEYVDVSLMLSAILLQVGHNLATGADTRYENTSTTAERSPLFNMQDKLKLLDLEYELIDEYTCDTEIDYCKPVVAFTECLLLFALTDAGETWLPGYLCKNLLSDPGFFFRSPTNVSKVSIVSRLDAPSRRTRSCFILATTTRDGRRVREGTCLSSIRTPIGLHEFCEYIVREEENWIKREQETRQSRRTDLTGRFMKKSIEVEDDAIILDDECFMLPDSVKARLKKSLDRDGQKKIFRNEGIRGGAGEELMSGKTSMTEKKSDTKIDDVDTSVLSAKKILSVQCVETGGGPFFWTTIHRVRVELENWRHGDLDLRIAVTLQHCTLRLSGGVSRRNQSADTFHLTTRRGIMLGFSAEIKELQLIAGSTDTHPITIGQNLILDFRASWPSGLLIEPTVGDSTKNPFCIRQSYISKRSGRAGAAREVCRNFFRNGTVLKYLDDNTVVILRPNSVIVTCMDFNKPQSRDESIREMIPNKFRIKKSNSRQSLVAKRSSKVIDSIETRSNESILDVPSKQCVLSEKFRDSLITGVFTAGKVLRYSMVNYDGRRYEVLNDLVVSEHDRLLVRTTSDYEVNEIFTRRVDGTDMLLRSNGELIVTFPGINHHYAIEEQPVICEWTENKLQRYFGVTETKEYSDRSTFAVVFQNRRGLSIAGGFVSILLTFRTEHKDYAFVSYDQSAVSCTLSMPDNLRVSISRRGHYEVSIGDEVNLDVIKVAYVFDDDVTFSKKCATCGGRSISTYKFRENVLEIESDGTTRYSTKRRPLIYRKKRALMQRRHSRSLRRKTKLRRRRRRNLEARIHCKHELYCEMLKFPMRSQYRIFAMNRDLTACEHLHRSDRREQEVAAVFDETSMIQYPISRRPELRRLITFVPVKPELGSKEISLVSERTRNEVLAKRNEQSLPKLLRMRVFFGIKGADRSVLRDGDKCRLFYGTGSSRPCEVKNDYGVRRAAYETWLTKASRQSSRLAELLRQRDSMKEEYEWYINSA